MPVDYSEYPDDWHEISKYIRFTRAENKCETCGAANYAPHPVTGSKVILTVAYIRPDKHDVRYNPANYDPEDETNNLVAECQLCHLWRDRHLHAHRRKYGAPNDAQLEMDL